MEAVVENNYVIQSQQNTPSGITCKKNCEWCGKAISIKNISTHYKRCHVLKSKNDGKTTNELLKMIEQQRISLQLLKQQIEIRDAEIKLKDAKILIHENALKQFLNPNLDTGLVNLTLET
tara:strand:- start:892 stop:1251 length:360 start_codon:yes stop_codon:yes gene_type:complete